MNLSKKITEFIRHKNIRKGFRFLGKSGLSTKLQSLLNFICAILRFLVLMLKIYKETIRVVSRQLMKLICLSTQSNQAHLWLKWLLIRRNFILLGKINIKLQTTQWWQMLKHKRVFCHCHRNLDLSYKLFPLYLINFYSNFLQKLKVYYVSRIFHKFAQSNYPKKSCMLVFLVLITVRWCFKIHYFWFLTHDSQKRNRHFDKVIPRDR